MVEKISVSFDCGQWWAHWHHPKIGPVDACGATKDMAISNIAPKIRKAHRAYMAQRFEAVRDKWIAWEKSKRSAA